MWKNKRINLITAVLLIGSLAVTACSKSNSGSETTTSPSPSASTTASAAPTAPPKTPFTFTMNTDNPNINWTSEVAQEITKRTGATIKWDVITGDFRTKMNVWLAAGDYPEVVNIHDNTLQSYVTAKAVLDLTDLIKQHAPNIMKAYNNDLSQLQWSDGKIYGLLQPPTKKVVKLNDSGWIAIQAAVLKDAGYPQIKTLEDVETLVSNYMKKYPEIGGGKTIGFSNFGAANALYNVFDTAARAYAGFATNAQYFVDDQNNARLRFFEPGYTDVFKFFNKINQEGLFDPESLVQTQEQFTTKCNQGRVLVVIAGTGCTSTLAKNGMEDRSYISFEIVAPGKTKMMVKPSLNASRGGDMWLSITKNAKDPVRIIQFYDDMFKLENQILVGWGIEGKYYKVENGKRVVTDWFIQQTKEHPDDYWEVLGIGYARPLSTNYASGFTLSDGDFANYSSSESWISKNMNKTQVDTLAKYNAKTMSDLLVKGTEKDYQFAPTIAKWTPEITKFNTEAIAEWGKALPKFILEKDASKLDGVWADLQKTLKDKGLDKQNADVTKIYQDYLKTVK
jgi:putative aldouronate transport system substrate-binding protein